MLTEALADLAITAAVFHHEPTDEGVWRRLKMMLDGDLDPAEDFLSQASDKSGLIFGARRERFDPGADVRRGALISELFDENGDFGCISSVDGADSQFRSLRNDGIAHVNIFSRNRKDPWMCDRCF